MPNESADHTEPGNERIDDVIAAYLKAARSGTAPSAEELLAGHPELADQLAEFLVDEKLFDDLAVPLRAMASTAGLGSAQPAEAAPGRAFDTSGPACDTKLDTFGDYRLLEEIARGGMGVVYRACQISLNRPVALKMILAGRLASADDVRRFQIEAEAAAQLDHPNIVSIYEVGQNDGRQYFSMKLVEAGDLTEHISRFTEDPSAAARFTATVARAIHHAHQRGILHRDLKPQNILIDAQGQPQITDFGLAKRLDHSSGLTRSGTVLGTACYMAPEQARAEKDVTVAVDVYSLGAILYELLTGRPPFRGSTPAGTMLKLLEGELQHPRTIEPKIDRDLETICLKCLEQDPKRRYGSAEALAEDLQRWLAGKPISARAVTRSERVWRWCGRNPLATGALAIIVLLSGYYYWRLLDKNRETRWANIETRQALDKERTARDQAQDALVRSLYEQARATRVSGELGRRWEVFSLLGRAEQLRDRELQTAVDLPPSAVQPAERGLLLPSRADLRSEAVATLLLPDARAVWELPIGFGAQPALSFDGRLAAHLRMDKDSHRLEVVLVDMIGRSERGRFYDKDLAGTAFALSRDGHKLASFDAKIGKVSLWYLLDGRKATLLDWPIVPGPADQPRTPGLLMSSEMAFSPNGRYLTAIYRWPLPQDYVLGEVPENLRSLIAERNRPGMTSWLGDMIQTYVLWDLEGTAGPKTLAATLQDTNRGGAVFSRDGRLLAVPAGEKTVRLWDLETGQEAREIQLPVPLVGKITFGNHGQRLFCPCRSAATGQSTVVIWDLVKDREQTQLDADFPLTAATPALSPDGNQLAVGTKSGRIVLFDLVRRQVSVSIRAAHTAMVAVVRWDPAGRHLFSWGIEGNLKSWQLGERPVSDVLTGQEAFGFALSPDGRWLAFGGGPEGVVQLFDRRTSSVVQMLSGYSLPLPGLLLFSSDSRQLAQVGAYQVVVWNVSTGHEVQRLEESSGLAGRIDSVAFTDRGALLACVVSSTDPKLTVRNVTDGHEIWRSSDGEMHTGRLTPDGRLLAELLSPDSSGKETVAVVEVFTGKRIAETELLAAPFGPRTFSPDGAWLVTLDVPQSAPWATFAYLEGNVAAQANKALNLQSFPIADEQKKIVGSSTPTAHAFDPHERLLAIGYQDGSATLWDIAANEEIFHVGFCSQPVFQLAFTPDGESLAVTDTESPIQFIDLTGLRRQLVEIGLDW